MHDDTFSGYTTEKEAEMFTLVEARFHKMNILIASDTQSPVTVHPMSY